MNHLTISGNVGQPPELRVTPSGMSVLEFTVASTMGRDDKKKTTWFSVVCFSKLADNTAATIQKGDTVVVVGHMETDEYKKKDGTQGKFTKVVADDVAVSCKWNAWVKDQTEKVMTQVLALHDEDEAF